MTREERFWIALDSLPDMTVWRFTDLYNRYRTRERFFAEQSEIAPFDEDAVFGKLQKRLDELNAHVFLQSHPQFPSRLRTIPDAPPILYAIGDISLSEGTSIAMIGSRRYTAYGAQCARLFASAFARHDVCVVSGMADGIDGTSQRMALEEGGNTVAILAGGIDHIYPAGNRDLYETIAERGLILSESPPGFKPNRRSFPYRNRLISGLSDGVLIVEAAAASGTMSTVEHALDQSKPVYAVPGSIFSPLSEGTNQLIKDGCICVTDPADILEACGIRAVKAPIKIKDAPDPSLTDEQKRILDFLEKGPAFFEDIQASTGLSVDACNMALTMLEITGYILKEPGRQYLINRGK